MGDICEIGPQTKIINLNNWDQRQLLEFLREVADGSTLYLRAQECLIKEFPRFEELRLSNITILELLAGNLDEHHKNCNIATIVGSCVGIVGGLGAITGLALMTVATGGAALLVAAPAIATAGGVAATAGGLTSFGTFVTEGIIQKAELEKINRLLKEDEDYFERVFPFVERIAELKAAVEKIMNFSVFQSMMQSFGNNPDVVNAIREERPMQELPQGMKDFINDLPVSADQKRQLKDMLLAIMGCREGIRLFKKILDFFWRVAPFISKTYRLLDTAARIFRVADASFDAGSAMANLVKAAKPATKMAVAFGALSAVAVAIDVVVLVNTSKDMAKGSKSELAGKVQNSAKLMQDELDTLKQIYDGILAGQNTKKCH